MTDSAAPTAATGGTDGSTAVALEIPADVAFLGVVRSLAAGLAARLPFTLDEIDDFRIAVDEAVALLVPLAAPGSAVTLRFTLGALAADVAVDVAGVPGAGGLDRTGFSWTVLESLAHVTDVRETGDTVGLTLHKDAEEAADLGLTGRATDGVDTAVAGVGGPAAL